MKREMMILIWFVASFQLVFGQPEVRKPSVEVFINGKMYQQGDELTVQKGQLLDIKAIQKGGRRDLVNYPDNYLKINSETEILNRGVNQLIYSDKGVRKEWKLLLENATLLSDGNVSISKNPVVPNEGTVRVGAGDFVRTYLKVSLSTTWQFNAGEEQKTERNESEAMIYLNIAGSTDTWFVSKNIHVTGTKNEILYAKLVSVQSCFDSIESSLVRMDYAKVQRDIRTLQTNINFLNEQLQELRQSNPAFKTRIHLVGLPSDRSISDLAKMDRLHTEWNNLNSFVMRQNEILNGSVNNNTQQAKVSVQKYMDWQFNLPDGWMIVLNTYIPALNVERVLVPLPFQAIAEKSDRIVTASEAENVNVYFRTRAEEIVSEIQQIAQARNKLQAVKLFDGMLRSYISSINWAEWENTREVGYAAK